MRWLTLVALALVACGAEPGVERIFDGRVVEGAYVPPEAYAAFLRGAMAAEAGDLKRALGEYVEAARYDDQDPEIWTRIGQTLCALDRRDVRADRSFARALALDPAYAGAFAERARCELGRGDPGAAAAAARRAGDLDPMSADVELLLEKAATGPRAAASRDARDRLVALTLVHEESPAAWEALAAWARSHDDDVLLVRGEEELVRRAPDRRAEVAGSVPALAGEGDVAAARAVAAALVDVPGGGAVLAQREPLVARLAVDEALARDDADAARLRSTRTHLGLAETAGRALVLGHADLALAIAGPIARADPGDVGARMVLGAAAAGSAPREAYPPVSGATSAVPAPAWVAYGLMLSRAVSSDAAKRALAAATRDPVLPGDALVTGPAVELAVRGVIAEDELPLDARVELAARRFEPPPPESLATGPAGVLLDARHELLALSLTQPSSPRTRELMRRLEHSRSRDSLVAVGWARALLGSGQPLDDGVVSDLRAGDPADPLVAAAVLDVARRRGEASVAERARASLSALAGTPGERDRARE